MDPKPARRKRFISEFAELEPTHRRRNRGAWVAGVIVLLAGLGLALYDLLFAR